MKNKQQQSPAASAARAVGMQDMAEPKVKLTDLAYEQIEEAIITLRIPPGTVVSELTLSEMINIGQANVIGNIFRIGGDLTD